jgi:predicted deacetylase
VRALVVAIHDLAPSTLAEGRELRAMAAEIAPGPAALLVVPRRGGRERWDGESAAWVRARAADGDEVVLHGYSHALPDGRDGAELGGLPEDAIAARLALGMRELGAAGIAVGGFVAPAYGHGPAADAACRALRLPWWATRGSLRWADGAMRLPSVGLGASSPGRRALSPPVARMAGRLLSRAPALRLDLHPADLRHLRLARAAGDLLRLLAEQGRAPATHAGCRARATAAAG